MVESNLIITFGAPSPEVTLVKASASYEKTSGAVGFNLTTAAEPQAQNSQASMLAGLFQATSDCDVLGFEHNTGREFLAFSAYKETTALGTLAENLLEEPEVQSLIPVTKTVSGGTTIFSTSSSQLAEKTFNCAVVGAEEIIGPGETEPELADTLIAFPLVPQAAPSPPAQPAPAPPPAPAPAVLSIGKLKQLQLKTEKWKTVRVKVTNSGGTATAQGSLRVKAPAGALVKPKRHKLPALAPGGSWSISVRVKLTKKAKKRSTLHLTGIASGVTGKRSLITKRKL